MGSFYKDAAFDAICYQHTHVLSVDGGAAPVKIHTSPAAPAARTFPKPGTPRTLRTRP
jgi:hypothetical protein